MADSLTGIVLAGGHSTRMGQDKAGVTLLNKTLLEWVLDAMRQVCNHLLVVTSSKALSQHRAVSVGAMVVEDKLPDRGPLGGLYTGLQHTSSDQAMLVGCDTPFLQPGLLQLVVEAARGRDAGVPRLEGVPQTLQGVYSRRCLPTIEGLLAQGRPGLRDLLPLVDVAYLERDKVIATDPSLLSFFNINSEAHLAHAQSLLGREEP